ncbi:hypothetical protein [Phormidesmis sp. 146-20]
MSTARHNNSNAADGRKSLVLSLRLLAAADLSRSVACMIEQERSQELLSELKSRLSSYNREIFYRLFFLWL